MKQHKYINGRTSWVGVFDERGRSVVVFPYATPEHLRKPDAIYVVEGAHYAQFVESGQLAPFPEPMVEDSVAPHSPAGVDASAAGNGAAGDANGNPGGPDAGAVAPPAGPVGEQPTVVPVALVPAPDITLEPEVTEPVHGETDEIEPKVVEPASVAIPVKPVAPKPPKSKVK